jgi:hypothetical protein
MTKDEMKMKTINHLDSQRNDYFVMEFHLVFIKNNVNK